MGYRLITIAAVAVWCTALGADTGRQATTPPAQKPAAGATTTQKPGAGATAELKDREGQTIGQAKLTETPHGVLISLNLDRAPAGERAFHIHQVGRCDPPTFESAGGHLNPTGAQHGFLQAKGPHAGDMPNVHVPKDGRLTVETLARGVTLQGGKNSLLDADGSALVMHAKPDDYRTDPAGAAGDRIACGLIQK
jgi:Cu-Zn family superoxide dismutase